MSDEAGDTEGVQITLDLGALQLNSHDFLCLRPGMTLEFALPKPFHAALQLDGVPWIQAEANLVEDRVVLQITGLVGYPVPS